MFKKVVVERRSYKARSASASFVEARIYRLSRRHPQKDRVVYFCLFIITKNAKLNKGEKGIYQQQQNKDSNSFIRLFFFPVHCCLCKTHRMGWLSYFSSCWSLFCQSM